MEWGRILDDVILNTQPGFSGEAITFGQLEARQRPWLKSISMFRSFTGRMTGQRARYTSRIGENIKNGNLEAASQNLRQFFWVTMSSGALIPFIIESFNNAFDEGLTNLYEHVGLLRKVDEAFQPTTKETINATIENASAEVRKQLSLVLGSDYVDKVSKLLLKSIGEMTESEMLKEIEIRSMLHPFERTTTKIDNLLRRLPNAADGEISLTDLKAYQAGAEQLGILLNIPESF